MIIHPSASILQEDAKSVKVEETIQELPTAAFSGNKMLMEVSLPKVLRVIGPEAFLNCSLLSKVRMPMTCKEIGARAFLGCCSLQGVLLPSGLTCVQEETFSRCSKLKTMAVPWAVVVIEHGAFSYCTALLSVELPKGLKKIESRAFAHCEQLKNIEIPKSVNRLGDNAFDRCERNLEVRFGVNIEALERRFDDLPLHKVCYYQAHYTPAAKLKRLEKAIRMDGPSGRKSGRSGGVFSLCRKVHSTLPMHDYDPDSGLFLGLGGYFVDSFGMTPLHILVLSARPSLAICETLLAHYPSNVTCKDRYGNTPIDYACIVNVPIPIVEVLLQTLQHQLNTILEDERVRLKNFLSLANQYDSMEVLLYLTHRYFHVRSKELGLKQWKQDVVHEIETLATLPHAMLREEQLEQINGCLCQYEQKETLLLLELALWKARMRSELSSRKRQNHKGSRFSSSSRRTCQIQSGAEIVIPLLMPYLTTDYGGHTQHCCE